jgi:hypothetical protein
MQCKVDGEYATRGKAPSRRLEERDEVRILDQVAQTVEGHDRQVHPARKPKVLEVPPHEMLRWDGPTAEFASPGKGRCEAVQSVDFEPPGRPEASEGRSAAGEFHR